MPLERKLTFTYDVRIKIINDNNNNNNIGTRVTLFQIYFYLPSF